MAGRLQAQFEVDILYKNKDLDHTHIKFIFKFLIKIVKNMIQ